MTKPLEQEENNYQEDIEELQEAIELVDQDVQDLADKVDDFDFQKELEPVLEEIDTLKTRIAEFVEKKPPPPQIVEKTVIVEGKPGPRGLPGIGKKGDPGEPGKNAEPLDPKPIAEDVYRRVLPFIPQGGGAPNRQISINSSVIGQPYNDFNFIGSIAGITNNTTKKTDIFFSGGGASGIDTILATVSVNLASVGATSLYTVPAGKTAIITGLIVKPTTASGVDNFAQAGVGVASGEDDMFAVTEFTGLDTTSKVFQLKAEGTNKVGAAADIIKIGVDVAASN